VSRSLRRLNRYALADMRQVFQRYAARCLWLSQPVAC
jgi:hypothetical protein